MPEEHNVNEAVEDDLNPGPVNRRRVLKQMATSGAVIAGIGAATGSASAQSSDDNSTSEEESSDIGTQGWQGVKQECVNRDFADNVATIDQSCTGAWNVYTNPDNYADYILDTMPGLNQCRSRSNVTAEIEAHAFDNDPGNDTLSITCGGWGIDSTEQEPSTTQE